MSEADLKPVAAGQAGDFEPSFLLDHVDAGARMAACAEQQ